MKKLVLTSIFLLPLLTGCAFLDFFQKKDPVVDLPPPKPVFVDREVLQPCDKLPGLELGTSQEELNFYTFTLLEKYGICANKQDASIKTIKKLGNIE